MPQMLSPFAAFFTSQPISALSELKISSLFVSIPEASSDAPVDNFVLSSTNCLLDTAAEITAPFIVLKELISYLSANLYPATPIKISAIIATIICFLLLRQICLMLCHCMAFHKLAKINDGLTLARNEETLAFIRV